MYRAGPLSTSDPPASLPVGHPHLHRPPVQPFENRECKLPPPLSVFFFSLCLSFFLSVESECWVRMILLLLVEPSRANCRPFVVVVGPPDSTCPLVCPPAGLIFWTVGGQCGTATVRISPSSCGSVDHRLAEPMLLLLLLLCLRRLLLLILLARRRTCLHHLLCRPPPAPPTDQSMR